MKENENRIETLDSKKEVITESKEKEHLSLSQLLSDLMMEQQETM